MNQQQQPTAVELLAQHVTQYFTEKLKFAPNYDTVLKHSKRMEIKNPEGFKFLRSILKNINNKPEEIKYRKIKKSNKKISESLCSDFKFLLGEAGWEETETEFDYRNAFIEANTDFTCQIIKGEIDVEDEEVAKIALNKAYEKQQFPIEDDKTLIDVLEVYKNDEEVTAIIKSRVQECK